MSMKDLNQSRAALLAIDPKNVKRPSTPVEDLVKEVHKLYYWSLDDKTELLNIGISESSIESLLPLSRALRAAESNWIAKKNESAEIHVQWNKESKEAIDLRSRILHAFRYAYKDNELMNSKLKHIGLGHSQADLIQDLSDLSFIGKEHPEKLNAINFDMNILNTSIKVADRLGVLLGQTEANIDYHEAIDLRNRAYTKLMEVVKDIRAAGLYVFWRNSERAKGYKSEYNRKHRSTGSTP